MNLSAAPEHVPDVNELSALRKYLQQFSSYDQDTGFPNCETLLAEINTEITKASPLPLGATLIEIRIRGLSRIGEAYSRKAIGSVIRQLADRLALAPSNQPDHRPDRSQELRRFPPRRCRSRAGPANRQAAGGIVLKARALG